MRFLCTIALIVGSFFLNNSFAQDNIQLTRKLNRLTNAENNVYRLPYEKAYIRSTILPEVNIKKEELAPNYPDLTGLSSTEVQALQSQWIINFPEEFDKYTQFLDVYVRSHFNSL